MERILFLDIDGVLYNEPDSSIIDEKILELKANGTLRLYPGVSPELVADIYLFCPVATDNLNKIIKSYPDLKIVLISSWRHIGDIHTLRRLFSHHAWSVRLISKTGEAESRSTEVEQWLDTYISEKTDIRYVILDDVDDYFSQVFPRHFIYVGGSPTMNRTVYDLLSETDAQRAIDILR